MTCEAASETASLAASLAHSLATVASPSQFTIFLIRNDRCDDVLLLAADYSKIVSEAVKTRVISVPRRKDGERRSSAAATFAFE